MQAIEAASPDQQLEDQLAIAQLITEHAADAIFLLDSKGRTTFANPAAEAMFGWSASELKGRKLHDIIHYQHPDGQPFPMEDCPLGNVFLSGRSVKLHEDLFFHKNGTAVPVACSNAAISKVGVVVGGVLIARDISKRQAADKHRQLLINELNHRVKNTLAIVQSIAQQSFKSGDVQQGRAAFDGRLAALSTAHNLLTESSWTAASLGEIVRQTVHPFADGDRVRLSGPTVDLLSKTCVALSLVIHELATNATKYGALSTPEGMVSVTWHVVDGPDGRMLDLEWQETGGPRVGPPQRRGFGSRLIEKSLAFELQGRVDMSFEPEGVRCALRIPLKVDDAAA